MQVIALGGLWVGLLLHRAFGIELWTGAIDQIAHQRIQTGGTFACHMTVFSQQAAQMIAHRRMGFHILLVRRMERELRLLRGALDGSWVHTGIHMHRKDGVGIVGIVLFADALFGDKLRRHQLRLIALRQQLTAPVIGTTAGFHHPHDARTLRIYNQRLKLREAQCFAGKHFAICTVAIDVKMFLGKIHQYTRRSPGAARWALMRRAGAVGWLMSNCTL